MMEILKWKSFTLVTNVNDNNDDDIQSIAKKLTINSIANNLCIIIHDNDEKGMKLHSSFSCVRNLTFNAIFLNYIQ